MVKTLEFTLKKMIFQKVKLKIIQATTEYPLVLMFFYVLLGNVNIFFFKL